MASKPVLFIHGLWLHATSWDPWVERFREAGYSPLAPGWPGEPAVDTPVVPVDGAVQVTGSGFATWGVRLSIDLDTSRTNITSIP